MNNLRKRNIIIIDYCDYANVLTEWSRAINEHSDNFQSKVLCTRPHKFSYKLKHNWNMSMLNDIPSI